MDLLKPEYNILKKAGSSLGFTHSVETKAKMKETHKNRIVSEEEKTRVSKMYIYRSKESKKKDIERLLELNVAKSHPIEVVNVVTKEKTFYPSIRQGASELGVHHSTIIRVLNSKKLLRATYRISYVNK